MNGFRFNVSFENDQDIESIMFDRLADVDILMLPFQLKTNLRPCNILLSIDQDIVHHYDPFIYFQYELLPSCYDTNRMECDRFPFHYV